MASYWDDVPRGVWRVADAIDAANVLSDPESRFVPDSSKKRLYVYGPEKKAVWIDFNALRDGPDTLLARLKRVLDNLGIEGYL